MADISAWSPVDESNTAAPPNGWPENMQVSGINNCARAMMGAVRRFYDKLNDGSFVFSTITCSGTITGGAVNSNSNINFAGTLSGPGTISGGAIISSGDIIANGTITAGTITSNGDMSVAGTLAASVAAVTNTLTAGAIISNNNISAAGTLTAGIANITNTLTANHVTTNGADVFGTLNAYTVAVSGTCSADLLTANSISSNNAVNAAAYNLRNATFAFMDAGATYTQLSDPGGPNITLYANGNNSYQNNTHWFQSRGGFSSYARFDSIGTYNQSGSWAVISDDRLKRNVEPYTAGLDALLRLTPRSFEYTERAPWPGRSYGLMASEVKGVAPEMVGEAEFDGVLVQTLAPTHAVYLLINACKELAARVAVLEEGR
jgi:cytoskeletal protein CcmA (bactofilin family)